MTNKSVTQDQGVVKLKPWRKENRNLRQILDHPEPIPPAHPATICLPPITSIVRELFRWQRLHQDRLLNPNAMVTEQAMLTVLPHDLSPPTIRPHAVIFPAHVKSRNPKNFGFHVWDTGRQFLVHNIPRQFAPEEDMLAGCRTPVPRQSSVRSGSSIEGSFHALPPTLMPLPKPSRPLLRRPLVKRQQDNMEEDPSSTDLRLHTKDLKAFTTFSLTTLDVGMDDPLDLTSFYNTHYPLILKSIPCRSSGKGKGAGGSQVYLYHPMAFREISTTMFHDNPMQSPTQSVIEQDPSHTLSSTLRMLNSTKPDDRDTHRPGSSDSNLYGKYY